jgi:hypothetical protein
MHETQWPVVWAGCWAATGIYLLTGVLTQLLVSFREVLHSGPSYEFHGGLRELLWFGLTTAAEVVAWPWHFRSWMRRQRAARRVPLRESGNPPANPPPPPGDRDVPVQAPQREELFQQAWHGH